MRNGGLEARLAFLDQCPFGACVLKGDLVVRFWNTCLEGWTGISRGDILGTLLSARYGMVREPEIQKMLQDVLEGRGSQVLSFDSDSMISIPIDHQGRQRLVTTTVSLMPSNEKDEREILLSLQDVTELAQRLARTKARQRDAEGALRESEERFRLMVDSAPVMLWLSGPDGRFSFFNRPWLEFTGRTLEQELGYGWMEGLASEDREDHWRFYVSSCQARRPFETELHLRRADGEQRWVLHKGEPRYTPEGRYSGYIGSCFDITERKESELALARFRAVMNHAGAAIFVTDAQEGRLVDVNGTACRWLGRSYDEMLELRAQDFTETLNLHTHDNWSEAADELKAEYLRRRTVERPYLFKETFHRRRDGSTFPVEVLVSRKEFQGGEYLLVVVRDIAERKDAEDNLRASENKLRQLTRHLHTVREEERKRIAREIHDELGQTLTALKLDLSWMAAGRATADMVERAANLVDKAIETVQRIAADLRPQVLDDLGLVAALEWHAQHFTAPFGLKCRFFSDVERATLPAERATHVFRIFQETLTNVARHAQASKVMIDLHEEDGKLILQVEDNGRGISHRDLADLSSIGLIGMRERALLCDGDLSIERVPKGGTRVVVTIPISEDAGNQSLTLDDRPA